MRRLLLAVLSAGVLTCVPSANAFQTWGNIEYGDCAFAAAANWEVYHGGTTATDESIVAEYLALDPEEEGIDGDQLKHYWRTHGIAGRKVNVRVAGASHLRRVIARYGPTIVQMAVMPGQAWRRLSGAPQEGDTATSVVDNEGGVHFALITAVNSHGPVILSWGQLAQMTWWQWREDALLLYI